MRRRRGAEAAPGSEGSRAVNDYLEPLPPEMRTALERVRATVQRAAPSAEELISYRIPAFRYRGRLLVWYAGFKEHASFFPGSLSGLEELAAEMKPYAVAKGTLRFTPKRPLPRSLLARIVKLRVASIEARGMAAPRTAAAKSKKPATIRKGPAQSRGAA
ncbi:MAG: DUF1801 domain-containing protein [Thermoplasmata archaeon]|nr:DUF1801 domain-containing protein [Thermoplasmata archaeon]